MQFELRKAQKSALKIRKVNKRSSHKNGKHDRYWFNTVLWLEPSSPRKFASKQLANRNGRPSTSCFLGSYAECRNARVVPRPAVVTPRPTSVEKSVTCNARALRR